MTPAIWSIFVDLKQYTVLNGIASDLNVVVTFLFQVIFVFLLFFGMVMYANEVETKEK